uniref:Ral guanine nucleotide dissociation stimulator-like 3 n=1 Tax=Mus musculus TaxID=10090 RepID=A0A1L1ST67_MOUSE
MERTAGKELALAPLQDWGEETEDGAVYSVSLRRQRSQRSTPERSGEGQGRQQEDRGTRSELQQEPEGCSFGAGFLAAKSSSGLPGSP